MRVINFFGGPGAGKSTAALGLSYELKKRWISVEYVNEYAKELFWNNSPHLLSHQNLIMAEQERRLNRLVGKVDVAVTDSPLLLSCFYAPRDYPPSFRQSVFDFFDTYDNINIFVRRSHHYAPVGRVQNEDESDILSRDMEGFLYQTGVPYYAITANDASPRYLLYWLASEGIIELPEATSRLDPLDAPPAGWIEPTIRQMIGPNGEPVRDMNAVLAPHIPPGVRTIGVPFRPTDQPSD